MGNNYYVYVLTNWNNNVIYTGITNDLSRRLYEHQNKMVEGFTEKYSVTKLVYFEETTNIEVALNRERRSRNGEGKRRISLLKR